MFYHFSGGTVGRFHCRGLRQSTQNKVTMVTNRSFSYVPDVALPSVRLPHRYKAGYVVLFLVKVDHHHVG